MVRRGDARKGNAIVEFSLASTIFLALLFGIFDFSLPIYIKATLRHAVGQGVRYAITGQTEAGMGHDASIRQVIRENSIGVLDAADDSYIEIEYFDSYGNSTTANDPGNLLVVTIRAYPVARVAPVLWDVADLRLTVSASDRMELFANAPTR